MTRKRVLEQDLANMLLAPRQRMRVLSEQADEKAIGIRLCQARKCLEYTQIAVANTIGIKRERLASYECGRVPLKADVGLAFCRRFNVCEAWLAEGESDMQPSLFSNSARIVSKIPPGALFSFAYRNVLRRYVPVRIEKLASKRCVGLMGKDRAESARKMVRICCESIIHATPTEHMEELANMVFNLQLELSAKWPNKRAQLSSAELEDIRRRADGAALGSGGNNKRQGPDAVQEL